MDEYHRLLRKVLDHGSFREDRTGVGAYSVFGEQSRYEPPDKENGYYTARINLDLSRDGLGQARDLGPHGRESG